jgi:hypothetical protein
MGPSGADILLAAQGDKVDNQQAPQTTLFTKCFYFVLNMQTIFHSFSFSLFFILTYWTFKTSVQW